MKSLSIEDIRNLFRLKKELNCNAKKKNGTKAIKERIFKDIRYLF